MFGFRGLASRVVPVVLLLGTLALAASDGHAADCIDYGDYWHEIGSIDTGWCSCITLHDDVVYVGRGGDLLTIDVTDGTAPLLTATVTLNDMIHKIQVVGSLALVANWGDGLAILDVADPRQPVLVSRTGTPDYARSATAHGQHAYVGEDGHIRILDISDLVHPEIVGSVETSGQVRDLVVVGGMLYAVDGSAGIRVYDLTDPAVPVLLTTVTGSGTPGDLELTGNRLHVGTLWGSFWIIDVTDPAQPELLVSHHEDLVISGGAITVVGDRVFLEGGIGGLAAFDVSDPAVPRLTGVFAVEYAWARDVAARGDRAYLLAPNLKVIDITKPVTPPELASLEMRYPKAMTARGSHAFAVHNINRFGGWLDVIDLSDPADPVLVGVTADTVGTPTCLDLAGDHAFVGDYWGGLGVVDIADPAAPYVIGGIDLPGQAHDVAIAGEVAYVACGAAGLRCVDIAVPDDLQDVHAMATTGEARGVAVTGGYLLATDTAVGLHVFECDPPVAPQWVASVALPDQPVDVTVAGTLAHVIDLEGGLSIIDVTDPTAPSLLGIVDLPGQPVDVDVDGATVYVADVETGLHVVDASDPAAPRYEGCFPARYFYSVLATADHVYAGGFPAPPDTVYGIHVLPLQCPSAVGVHDESPTTTAALRIGPNYPNPFNPSTTIGFELVRPDVVRLSVHDAAGRLVRRLIDGAFLTRGRHDAVWDGRDSGGKAVASGVYFYRLESGAGSVAGRMVLIR